VRFRRARLAETHGLTAELDARYRAAVDADAEAGRAAAVLEVAASSEDSADLLGLRARFPGVVGAPGAPHAPAPERALGEQALVEVEAAQHRLEADARRLQRCVGLLEDGERLRREGDARDALRRFDQACRECPSSRRARALAEACEPEAREQEARDRRAESLGAAARRAMDAGDWHAAIHACEEALTLRPGREDVRTLLQEAREGAAQERRHRDQLVRLALDRAAASLAGERWDDATAALDEADALDPQAAPGAPLRTRLDDAKAAAAALERIRELTEEELRQARAAFGRGAYDDAVRRLREAAREQPHADRLRVEAERLDRLRARIAETGRARRQRSADLVSAARALAAGGSLRDALGLARDAVQSDGTDLAAAALFDELAASDLRDRLEQEQARARELRSAAAEPLVSEARTVQARGYVGAALDLALSASRIAPDRDDVQALVADLRRLAETGGLPAPDLDAGPFPQPGGHGPPAGDAELAATPPRDRGGMLAHVNQWLSRRLPNR
jgi:tetratricopeptide (TPR) repeat protein